MNKLIIILGPTGVGKTETSLSVAEYFHIPIINADSRQIYKGIPIGTAAPTPDEQKRVKHYMTEVLNIGDYYNASMFENDVLNLLNRLYEHSNIALMSGGSMMYIDAVCYGMGEIPTVSDEIRNEMKRRLSQEGLENPKNSIPSTMKSWTRRTIVVWFTHSKSFTPQESRSLLSGREK